MKIMSVVGARPNFMKIAPFAEAIERHNAGGRTPPIEHYLVHTGQHYDAAMSESFFKTLGIPTPDVDLGVGSGSHAEQVGRTMIAFENVVRSWHPDWVVVVGDVNATCACSITAAKEHIRLAHIEAGLRSFDNRMPEEINRLVTDRLSDILFTTDEIADANLRAEGVSEGRIRRVGNIMIDTLEKHRATAASLSIDDVLRRAQLPEKPSVFNFQSSITDGEFSVLTLHRPSNVDNAEVLGGLVNYLTDELTRDIPLIWTLHPRTRKQLETFGLWPRVVSAPGILLVAPLDYFEMVRLNMSARIVLTDSGGLQEECCVLGTPCLTLRENTERPLTLEEKGGVSRLVGSDVPSVRKAFGEMSRLARTPHRPPLWDGHTAERIVDTFAESGKEKSENGKRKAESRKLKAESRKLKAES